MAANGSLRTPQRRAIAAMLTAGTVADAADAAGVGERTLYRWLAEDGVFRRALSAAQHKAIDAAVSRLAGEALAAVQTLASIHQNEDVNPAVRVQAARAILAEMQRLREQHELEERVKALEEQLR